MNKKTKKLIIVSTSLSGVYFTLRHLASICTEDKSIDDDNPYIDTCDCENSDISTGVYVKKIKPAFDRILSFGGMVILSPIFVIVSASIWLDDPGPIFFTQKRIGKDKRYILIHKFRSMRMNTPHDVPTHQLTNPNQYITRVGGFLRSSSLDELPQIWDIFRGKMSIIGPRPALWNQYDLIAEREKYGANNVLPGLTGLAQIKGRDELLIPEKARIDGDYVKILCKGGAIAFLQDLRCFAGTIISVLKHDGIVEGGTGSLPEPTNIRQKRLTPGVGMVDISEVEFEEYGFKKKFNIDKSVKKRVLITGAGSYIGKSFKTYCESHYPNIEIVTIDMKDGKWRKKNFSGFDTIFHVAGIAHVDNRKVTKGEQKKYYAVNTDLVIETAQYAKANDVTQFIFMSSMIIYGESTLYGKKVIDEYTVPSPSNFYGDSKWQADKKVRALADEKFKVAVLRPPMIYGKGSKGNYPKLSKLARKLPIFPDIDNERSMLYIENLCEFIGLLILSGEGGIYFPQNSTYTKTSTMVKLIGKQACRPILSTKILNFAVMVGALIPGKVSGLVNKVFGNIVYDQRLSTYDGLDYRVVNFNESIRLTESKVFFPCLKSCENTFEDYSVLMSVYDRDEAEYLKSSIESILGQTVLCKQFVIVEDGPINKTLEDMIEGYFKLYPELFTIIKMNQNVGLGHALDEGLKHCKYDLVARMDADDISKPERCQKLLELFQSNKHLAIAGTNIDEFYDNPANIISSRIVPTNYKDICRFIKRRSPFNHPTVMYRKSEVIRCGGYGKMRRKQDLDLFARMLNNGCYALNIDESLLLFRSNEDNYKRRKSWEYCKSYIEVERMNYKRGYCSFFDLAFVTIGQMTLYMAPTPVMKFLSDKLLRKKLI